MQEFLMPTSADVLDLLGAIAAEMVFEFGISHSEAVARINEQWRGQDLSREDEIILHEDARYWALFLYYGGSVPGWRPDADRSSWRVKPAPRQDSGCWTIPE